jgi:hypothetical protein
VWLHDGPRVGDIARGVLHVVVCQMGVVPRRDAGVGPTSARLSAPRVGGRRARRDRVFPRNTRHTAVTLGDVNRSLRAIKVRLARFAVTAHRVHRFVGLWITQVDGTLRHCGGKLRRANCG